MTADKALRETITVDKMDVARRQLKTAIRLWFEDGDPVAIHTLIFASHEITHRLFKESGQSDLMFDSTIIKDEHRKEYALMLKEDGIFFKHADRGTSRDTREFVIGRNFLFILMTAIGIGKMVSDMNDEESIFMYWCRVHHPSWFAIGEHNTIQENEVKKLRGMTKRELFDYVLAARIRFRESG
jgi:hypothetical protein